MVVEPWHMIDIVDDTGCATRDCAIRFRKQMAGREGLLSEVDTYHGKPRLLGVMSHVYASTLYHTNHIIGMPYLFLFLYAPTLHIRFLYFFSSLSHMLLKRKRPQFTQNSTGI